MQETIGLKSRFAQGPILLAPGVYDALTASIAAQAGFEALYLSGAAIAYTKLGRPDIGLVGLTELAETLTLIRDRVALPLIVDADTGFGNALNTQRAMRLLERAGANAIQLEDQSFPKRCGHLADKSLILAAEMEGKIRAAADARRSEATLIIARTDARAKEGFSAALDRAERYRAAGADMLFIEAPQSVEELADIARHFAGRIPVMANMVEGGKTPLRDASALEALGYALVIFPGGIVRAIARAAQDFYALLKRDGTSAAFVQNMHDFAGLNALIGTPDMLALGARYAPKTGMPE